MYHISWNNRPNVTPKNCSHRLSTVTKYKIIKIMEYIPELLAVRISESGHAVSRLLQLEAGESSPL